MERSHLLLNDTVLMFVLSLKRSSASREILSTQRNAKVNACSLGFSLSLRNGLFDEVARSELLLLLLLLVNINR